jgi:predicted DNA binding CopG/RHH family protein
MLNVRFESEDVIKIRQEAQKKGVGPTTLVRMWIKERLAA